MNHGQGGEDNTAIYSTPSSSFILNPLLLTLKIKALAQPWKLMKAVYSRNGHSTHPSCQLISPAIQLIPTFAAFIFLVKQLQMLTSVVLKNA